MPVIPTSTPMPNPKRTIAGSMVNSVGPRGVLIDFPDLLGQERGVRQDTKDVRLDSRPRPLLRRAANDRAARPRGARARGHRPGRALRLRQVDPAGAGLRPARAERRERRRRRRRGRRRAPRPLRLHAPARSASPLVLGPRQRRPGAAQPRPRQGRGPARSRGPVRALRPRRLRADGAGRALGRDAPAGRLPPHPRSPASRCWPWTSPSPPLDAITRAEMQEWLAGALRADPRTVVLVSHDVEEALYLSDRVLVLSAAPGADRRRAGGAGAAGPGSRRRRHRPGLRRCRERALHALRQSTVAVP